MHGYSVLFLLGISCLIIGGLSMLYNLSHEMFLVSSGLKQEMAEKRAEYQRRMRHVIGMMCDHSDAEIIDDLEWQLHSMIYEYRNGC